VPCALSLLKIMNPSKLISDFLFAQGITQQIADLIGLVSTVIILLFLAFISYWITKQFMVRLIEMGVDGIITNRPDILSNLLSANSDRPPFHFGFWKAAAGSLGR